MKLEYFNPKQITESGQCFRWQQLSANSFSLVAFGKYLEITQNDDTDFEFSCSEEEFNEVWKAYFDLEFDYKKIEKLIEKSGDEHVKEAFLLGSGIRILNQNLWEVIISFLISQNNNIKRISNSIESICRKAGIATSEKEDAFCFPGAFDVEPEFFMDKSLGLGYRDVYLRDMYEYTRENPTWFLRLREMDYEDAKKELLKRKGIGPKVADCICLFGLHKVDAFPVDTHVKQLLAKYYPKGFDFSYYKGVAGIIQQYLFFFELKNK